MKSGPVRLETFTVTRKMYVTRKAMKLAVVSPKTECFYQDTDIC